MPRCFQLTRKSDMALGPVILQDLDIEMCKHFNQPIDPDEWLVGWYHSIGLYLALGWSFEKIKAHFQESGDKYIGLIKITDYLNENFSTNSHWEPK